MPVNNTIQLRKGLSSEWASTNPVLASGEPGYDLTNNILKIGDGFTQWSGLNPVNLSGTYFNNAVSGLLPVKNIVAGSDISVSSISGIYTISNTMTSVETSASVVTTVFNKTGASIPKMTAVYIHGGQGDLPTIQKAIATTDISSAGTYGITYETINNMNTGRVIALGALTGLNTDQFNPTTPHGDVNGTVLYLSPTVSGALTTTKPYAPYHIVVMGTIVRTHQNEGVIEVRVQNGYELEELHNVAVTGATNGQFLQYNSVSGLWVPSSSGNFTSLQLNGTTVSVSGHTHTSSQITDFNSSVSGLLPVTNIVAGTGVSITSSSGIYAINSSSSSIDAGEYPLIAISNQPSGISVAEFSDATFSVTATASYPSVTISYQWQNSSDNTNWSNIVSANSSTLTLTSVTSSDNGKYYRCNLQSLLSNINSNSAQLTVTTGFTTTSVILSSNSNYTVPNGAKVLKIWSIGAGGSSSFSCDEGGGSNGQPGTVSYRHGFISNTNIVTSGSIGQSVVSVCDLQIPGGSTTLSNLSTVINPSISSLIGGGGGVDGRVNGLPSSGGLSTYTLWSNYTTRRDFVGINAVIDAAGGNSSTHTYGRGTQNATGNGSAGAIVMQFLPATDLVLPFTNSGSLTIPAGYSSVKIWVVGGGGIGDIYCDGGPHTAGGFGGISYKTWSVSTGQTITYNAGASLVGNFCGNPTNGNSSTATLNGTTITATAGLANGNNGSGSGGDGSGIYGSDVGGIYNAYLAYSPSVLTYGIRAPADYTNIYGLIGGIVLIKFIV